MADCQCHLDASLVSVLYQLECGGVKVRQSHEAIRRRSSWDEETDGDGWRRRDTRPTSAFLTRSVVTQRDQWEDGSGNS